MNGDPEKIKQLILIEEILNGLPDDMRMHLNEKGAKSSSELATLAGEYIISRRKEINCK